ncbi:MAG: serine hydrolase [Phycisphaerales bacterium JB043]
MNAYRALGAAITLLLTPTTTIAQEIQLPDTPAGNKLAEVVEAINSPDIEQDPAWFSEAFLAQVPPAQLIALEDAILTQLGELILVNVEQSDENAIIAAYIGTTLKIHTRFHLDLGDDGLIEGLLLRPASDLDGADDTWQTIVDDLAKLGEHTTLIAQHHDDTSAVLASHNADTRLAVGSMFKLYILGALSQHIHQGGSAWTDQLAIQPSLKSLPGGTMQTLADGTEHSLAHYALKMISISDNTATDHLLDHIGRDAVEAYMLSLGADDPRNLPFLSTREMFTIKLNDDPSVAERFAIADSDARRAMLASEELAGAELPALLNNATGWEKPRNIDTIEWFFSPRESADVMLALNDMIHEHDDEHLDTALTTNPGIEIDTGIWPRILFKGGSEPGVVNLTFLLERHDGEIFTLSVTVNDPDENPDLLSIVSLATRCTKMLEEHGER